MLVALSCDTFFEDIRYVWTSWVIYHIMNVRSVVSVEDGVIPKTLINVNNPSVQCTFRYAYILRLDILLGIL